MKRDFVEGLLKDITDEAKRKEAVDKIMAENGADTNKAKGDLDTVKQEKANLEQQLSAANTTIADLKKSNTDNEALQTKITELEAAQTKLNEDHQAELTKLARQAIDTKVIGKYKGKNEKAVKALIDAFEAKDDADYETLLESKVKALSEAEETKFMFGEAQTKTHYEPAGGGEPKPTSIGAQMATSRNTVAAPSFDPWGTSAPQTTK